MPNTAIAIMPTEQESLLARETREQLTRLFSHEKNGTLHVHAGNSQQADLLLPLPAVRLLLDALQEIGKGNGVTITPILQELTTQQAAEALRVSRPYLIEELLEKGLIPYRKVGNRRRIRKEDLDRFQETEEAEIARRWQVMLELRDETEQLGLYP